MMQRRMTVSDDGWRAEVAGSWEQAHASGTVAVADIVTNVAALDVTVPGVRYLESVALASGDWPSEQERLEPLLAAHRETGLSPHTLYTLGTAALEGSITLARRTRRRLHPHLAETADEDRFVRHGDGPLSVWEFAAELRDGAGNGRSPAAYLDSLGGLGADVHVAHGTHLDQHDRALLRARGTAVALCARSNAILGAGVPPVAALLREGGPIAVGTDSLASTPDLDLLAEARALAAAARAQGYAEADLAARILHACTAGGAYAIGRPDLGVLTPGATAALTHVRVERPDASGIVDEIIRSGRAEPALRRQTRRRDARGAGQEAGRGRRDVRRGRPPLRRHQHGPLARPGPALAPGNPARPEPAAGRAHPRSRSGHRRQQRAAREVAARRSSPPISAWACSAPPPAALAWSWSPPTVSRSLSLTPASTPRRSPSACATSPIRCDAWPSCAGWCAPAGAWWCASSRVRSGRRFAPSTSNT